MYDLMCDSCVFVNTGSLRNTFQPAFRLVEFSFAQLECGFQRLVVKPKHCHFVNQKHDIEVGFVPGIYAFVIIHNRFPEFRAIILYTLHINRSAATRLMMSLYQVNNLKHTNSTSH